MPNLTNRQECLDLLDELNALVEWLDLRRTDYPDREDSDDWTADDVRAVY
jgi:hypothetical protein